MLKSTQQENVMGGLLGSDEGMAIEVMIEVPEKISAEENAKTRTFMIENWMLGPDKTQQPNTDYWRKLATVWRISPDQARRNLCANCEYFDDSPDMLAEMESVPQDRFDKDGGGRGWCNKFLFICHNLRTCQNWERAEQKDFESEDYQNGNKMDSED